MRRALQAIITVFWTGLALLSATLVYAQTDPAAERATAFRAVDGPEAESIAGGPLLLGAYAVAWVFIFLYVFRLGRLSSRTAAELTRVEQSLSERGSPEE